MKYWLVKIIQNKYRCWDDYCAYGFVSAGHDDPESDSLKKIKKGDKIFSYFSSKGVVGIGSVKEKAVLAKNCMLEGDFIAKDLSGSVSKVRIKEIMLRCPHLIDDFEDPQKGEWILQVTWDYFAKKPKNIADIIDLATLVHTAEEMPDNEVISQIENRLKIK